MLLKELSNEKLFELVSNNETLRRSFDDYVWESEFDIIVDILSAMKPAISTWEIGMCNHNYIRVRDYGEFVSCARKCEKMYGLSDKCEKKLAQCEKLRGTNLFEHHAKIFSEMWFEEEIQSIVKWCEDLSYNVYCGKNPEDAYDYLDSWKDYANYIYDEEDGSVWEPAREIS